MKNTTHRNLAIALLASLFVITACSKTDSLLAAITVLPKSDKTTTTNSGTTTTNNNTYTYDGTKIVSKVSDDITGVVKTEYTYTGDLITKTVGTYKNGAIDTEEFTYNSSNKLITKVKVEASKITSSKSSYTYNTDGTVTEKAYDVVKATAVETPTKTITHTFSGNNLVKSEYTSGLNTTTTTYAYDTKNNPNKNVKGFLAMQIDGSENNTTKQEEKTMLTILTTVINTDTTTLAYTYDGNNYPTKTTATTTGTLVPSDITVVRDTTY